MADDQTTDKKIFDELNPDNVINEIESLCMNCEKNGTTRLLFTKIPFFREIILMSFECPECGYKSTEIQPGSALADTGILYDIKVVSSRVIIYLLRI
jgi:zinc finger protein